MSRKKQHTDEFLFGQQGLIGDPSWTEGYTRPKRNGHCHECGGPLANGRICGDCRVDMAACEGE